MSAICSFLTIHLWSWRWRGFLRCVCHCIWRVYCNLQAAWAGMKPCKCRLCCPHSWSQPWMDLQWPNQGHLMQNTKHPTKFSETCYLYGLRSPDVFIHTIRRIFSVDGEHGGFIGGPTDQTRAVRRHVSTVWAVDVELQRTLWYENKQAMNTMTETHIQQNGNFIMRRSRCWTWVFWEVEIIRRGVFVMK